MQSPARSGIPAIEFSSQIGIRDRPRMDAAHQTNVPGLYIVGDLADAPIIKSAFHQGFELGQHLKKDLRAPATESDLWDVLVIGAGPAGIGVSIALESSNLRVLVLEQSDPFSTIRNFPRGKKIFNEPAEPPLPASFWFEDAPKEELVRRWEADLESRSVPVQFPETVTSCQRRGAAFDVTAVVGREGLTAQSAPGSHAQGGATNRYRARRVVMAVGKRGAPNRLGIPGEELGHVRTRLVDPDLHHERSVVVIGGGDSAVEAAVALAKAGAQVTLSYRGDAFIRARPSNQAALQALESTGALTVLRNSRPTEFTSDAVRLQVATDGTPQTIPAHDVFVFIGNSLPVAFLKEAGVKLESEWDVPRWAWLGVFSLLIWMFYVLKHGLDLFPFRTQDWLGAVPALLQMDLGFRTVDGGFWGTVIYSLVVLTFGVDALRRHQSAPQRRRYLSLMAFQLVFLFGIPELLAPYVIDRPYKIYALTVPWPLSLWSILDAPSWVPSGDEAEQFWIAVGWIAAGALTSFGVIPWYVRRNGQKFCSYLCGCGGLAETLGDRWRHLAPRGRDAKRGEWGGRLLLATAVPVTLLILNDAWGFFAADALYSTKEFATRWYALVVDFGLASILGVALYPYLGNRVWCRFFCPLRAWMGILARRFAQVSIRSSDRCISCGDCSRACQMGIDVQGFAQRQEPLDNRNSACIQCGVCVEVCPMDVLELEKGRPVTLHLSPGAFAPPKASWE